MGRRVLEVASAFLELGSLLWTLFLRLLLSFNTDEQGLEPVMLVYRLRYDETPTRLRVADPKLKSKDLSTASVLEASEAMGSESSSLATKALQVECLMGALWHDKKTRPTISHSGKSRFQCMPWSRRLLSISLQLCAW